MDETDQEGRPAPRVVVVGSINLDLVVSVSRLPFPGETLTDGTFARHPGGKGANQALAAARMGAAVSLIACVGEDPMAGEATALLRKGGVDLGRVRRHPAEPTGVALIVVGDDGENQIVVAPGANRRLSVEDVAVEEADALLCQLEVPIETVLEAARQSPGLVCLNAAPVRPLPEQLLEVTDLLVVNEVEREALAPVLSRFRGKTVVTRGAAGATLEREGRRLAEATPPAVEAIDTVGSGDAFCGALVVALLEGLGEEQALAVACAAGALAATRRGAQTSLPWREEVMSLVKLT